MTSRIVARTVTPAGGSATTVRYGFNDGGDSPDWTLDGTVPCWSTPWPCQAV
ncbi:MAG: hypothetical protein AAGC66_02960 [Leifsonia sp.]